VPIGFRRPGRLAQLTIAEKAGVALPRTVLTEDAPAAAEFLGCERVVLKPLHEHFVECPPGILAGVFPEIWTTAELSGLRGGIGVPVIVQEHVEHDHELRAYFVDGAVYAYRVRKASPAAPWTDERNVHVEEMAAGAAMTAAVRGAVRKLAEAFDVRYAAFDLLVSGEEICFLELNPDGDWRWVELLAGQPAVSLAVAWMLRKLHLAAAVPPRAAR
jgi:glutathione synthase/RimK-type ligase-like ATP-grasp enzyme